MIAPFLIALFAGSDAVPAAVLDGWLAAAEAAYAHVEADCRFTHARAGLTTRTLDEVYVGSRGRGHLLRTVPITPSARSTSGYPTAWLLGPAYEASVARTGWAGWAVTRLGPGFVGPTLHPHAPCGLPFDTLSYRDHLRRRVGPVAVTAGERAGRPVWTAAVPLALPPRHPADEPVRMTLTLTATPPVLVLAARTDSPAAAGRVDHGCDIDYQPAAGGDWPAVRRVRFYAHDESAGGVGEQVAEFSRYQRLDAPPPAERFTLSVLGLPEPAVVPAEPTGYPLPIDPTVLPAEPPELPGPADGRWQWPAIAGIVAVGAVAFVWVGRRPAS